MVTGCTHDLCFKHRIQTYSALLALICSEYRNRVNRNLIDLHHRHCLSSNVSIQERLYVHFVESYLDSVLHFLQSNLMSDVENIKARLDDIECNQNRSFPDL